MVLGVTGKYCAGKDYACDILQNYGFSVVNEDAIGHQALENLLSEVTKAFGNQILTPSGIIDRRQLGALVFADQSKLLQLESITHPWMVDRTARLIEERETPHAAINAAILEKMGLVTLCDAVLYVEAPLPVRVFRSSKRDGLGMRDIFRRLLLQRELKPTQHDVDMYRVSNPGYGNFLKRGIERMLADQGILN